MSAGERNPSAYGDRWAELYDEWVGEHPDTEATVDFLVELAEGGMAPVLELGIGTGRIALPLAQRGVTVHGIDASEAMVAKLRAKPGGPGIPVSIGNFGELSLDQSFSVIFVVFNTFFALRSQDDQVGCFMSVARHLTNTGVFVIDAFVPDPARFERGQNVKAAQVELDRAALVVSRHDPVRQRVISQIALLGNEGLRLHPVEVRYAWPSELDLMAKLAGLELRERWGGWRKEPFTSDSQRHVSVYGRATRDRGL